MNLLDIARQCGAVVVNTRAFAKETRERITFEPVSQLTAFADRIRAEERERVSGELAQMHLDQLGRSTEHNYFAVASQAIRSSGSSGSANG
jgi:hypothetical protein